MNSRLALTKTGLIKSWPRARVQHEAIRSSAIKTPFILHLKDATWVGLGKSRARYGICAERFTLTLASSHPLGTGNLTTRGPFSVRSVTKPLHPGSACTVTCKHTSGEMKSTGVVINSHIGAWLRWWCFVNILLKVVPRYKVPLYIYLESKIINWWFCVWYTQESMIRFSSPRWFLFDSLEFTFSYLYDHIEIYSESKLT